MSRRNIYRGRTESAGQLVIAAYRERGAMTIQQVMHATGIGSESIRRIVREPVFEKVAELGGRGLPVVWRLRA